MVPLPLLAQVEDLTGNRSSTSQRGRGDRDAKRRGGGGEAVRRRSTIAPSTNSSPRGVRLGWSPPPAAQVEDLTGDLPRETSRAGRRDLERAPEGRGPIQLDRNPP